MFCTDVEENVYYGNEIQLVTNISKISQQTIDAVTHTILEDILTQTKRTKNFSMYWVFSYTSHDKSFFEMLLNKLC